MRFGCKRQELWIEAPRWTGGAGLLLITTVLGLSAAAPSPAGAQAPAVWTLVQTTPADADGGIQGAREPDLAAGGSTIVFRYDGRNGAAPADNPDGNKEIFGWTEGRGLDNLTHTLGASIADGQSHPTVDGRGERLAFLSGFDLAAPGPPSNADGSREVFALRDAQVPPTTRSFQQLSDDPGGHAAEWPAISRDGRFVAFWHDGDLTGQNADGGWELYRAELGGSLVQLTDLRGRPYHGPPDISGDGQRISFVLEADLVGDNADGGWELFRWSGPPGAPGEAARFRQLTDWRPPMSGRTLYDPTISDDGRRVIFAATGQVDRSLTASHIPAEIYLWDEAAGLTRLTQATGGRTASVLPRLSGDGQRVAFLSQSNFGGGNAGGNAEIFVWDEGSGIHQATDTQGRPGVLTIVGELLPALDGAGRRAAYIAETADDPAPLVLGSRLGILFRADDPAGPGPDPSPSATPGSGATPTATSPGEVSAGRVCPQTPLRVPPAVIADALAAPQRVEGWQQPVNPALPPSWQNPRRSWLALRDAAKPFGPFNGVIWKAGCP